MTPVFMYGGTDSVCLRSGNWKRIGCLKTGKRNLSVASQMQALNKIEADSWSSSLWFLRVLLFFYEDVPLVPLTLFMNNFFVALFF